MSLTEKILIWLVAGAFIAVCIVAAVEAIRPELPKGPRYE